VTDFTASSGTPQRGQVTIAKVINTFIHHARDVRYAARVFIPAACKTWVKQHEDVELKLNEAGRLLESVNAEDKIQGMKIAFEGIRAHKRLVQSHVFLVLESSLFVGLFGAYDAFLGDLLKVVFSKKPELYRKLKKSIDFNEILNANTIEDLRDEVLENEIENLKRESYDKQFSWLETFFDVSLKGFHGWPDFVECTQRRNLLVHCAGVVSEQYRRCCIKAGYPEASLPTVGTKLELGASYFFKVCELMIEVAFKLGQVLWRKLFPDEITEAGKHLGDVHYDALVAERWDRAKMIGEFSVSQKKVSNDMDYRIGLINYAIAQKFSGESAEAVQTLNKLDWSASMREFRLAEAVLLDKFSDAAEWMKKIGKSGEFLREHSYHSWPLFRNFRESEIFLATYREIYGYAYIVQVTKSADLAKEDSQKAIESQRSEIAVEQLSELPDSIH
jgi:hypothetical protein